MSRRPRVLVLGASGFFGGRICDELEGRGLDTVPASRSGTRGRRFDLLDPDGLRDLIATTAPDAVVNAAGTSSPAGALEAPTEAFRINVAGTQELLEALRLTAPDARLISLSSAAVYAGQPPFTEDSAVGASTPYAASKLAAEILCGQYARWAGLEIAVLRCFNLTGPGEPEGQATSQFARAVAGSGRVAVGDPEIARDITDVRDAARAVAMTIEAGLTGTYNLSSGEPRSLALIASTLARVSGRPLELESRPGTQRKGEPKVSWGENAKLARATGWAPTIPFESSLADLLRSPNLL